MFAGIVNYGTAGDGRWRAPLLADSLLGAMAPLHAPDAVGSYTGGGATLVQALNWNTKESKRESVPTADPQTGNILVSWLRIDNRSEVATTLGISRSQHAMMTDPELVLAAFHRWGHETAQHLEGDFAFAVFEPATRRVYLARDRMGIRPLYYSTGGEAFAFTTTLSCLRQMPGIDTTLSQRWLAFYLAGLSDSVPGLTALSGAQELLPGHHAVVTHGVPSVTRYHTFREDPPWATERDPQYVDAYRAEFFRAVGVRMRSAYPLGAENSGGLDSASIIAVVRELAGADARLETYGMPQFTEDERYMRLAIEHTGFGLHLFDRGGEGMFEAALKQATVLGHPPEVDASYYWESFAMSAESSGVRTLLSGHGGDDGVTNSGNLLFRELALRREWSMLRRSRYGGSRASWARTAFFVARQQRRTGTHRALRRFKIQDLQARGLTPEAISEFGLEQHALSLARWTRPYESLNKFILESQLVGSQIRRAAESCQVAFAHKVEYRYPMLDPRLIQLYLSTPSIEKRSTHSTRYLHRRALVGALQDPIRQREEKDPGVPLAARNPDLSGFRVNPADIAGTPVEGIVDLSRIAGNPPPQAGAWDARADMGFRLLLVLRTL